MTKKAKAPKSPTAILTPTQLNLSVLVKTTVGRCEFPNRISAVSAPHLRRCIKAGLLEPISRDVLRLTDAGVAALSDYIITWHADDPRYPFPTGPYTDAVHS